MLWKIIWYNNITNIPYRGEEMYNKDRIRSLTNQIVQKYNPIDIFLFGSNAKGLVRKNSDIDLCVIMNTDNKRKTIQDMLYSLDYDVDLDIVIYTEEEWEKYRNDLSTFAGIIYKTWVSLLGRYNK